ncbi:hypothetical protein Btru_025330 [Bulinus truncatus]|nr:hypothetical protein Btru_025330 [Bulinus truncatus]
MDENEESNIKIENEPENEPKSDVVPNDEDKLTESLAENTEDTAKEESMTGDGEIQTKDEIKKKKDDDNEDDDDEENEEDDREQNVDPNVIPQVNVALLSKRKWQVKVYPLKCADFMSGQIGRVFKYAKESLVYVLSPGKYSRGKGEMYVSSAKNAARVVHNLMKLDFQCSEINIEIIKKNDENEIEQKGHLRFDTKLVRMLCIPNVPLRRPGNKKLRSRGIGSVFVKNLPNDTTKEMLRVLFPFAAEVNYNPDKFKDGTARLVLDNRSNVVPCLKAFAKVELAGNVLELHPLEKRKETQSTAEKKPAPQKEPESTSPAKAEQPSTKETEINEVEEKKEQTQTTEKKDTTKPGDNKSSLPIKEERKGQKNRGRNLWFSKRSGGFPNEMDKRKTGGPVAAKFDQSKPETSPRGRLDRPDRKGPLGRDAAFNRSPRRQSNRGNRGGSGNRSNPRNNPNWNTRAAGGRNRFGSGGGFARNGRANRFDDPGFGGSLAGGSGDMGINVEATKEMMLLQNQLSLAIKNQIAMLNQTQMAVEQAKRGALTSDLAQGSSGEMTRSFAGNKRRANQAGFKSDYGDESYSMKRQNVSMGGQQQQQRSWADESSDYYSLQQQSQVQNYDTDRQGNDTGSGFGSGYNSRNLNTSNFTSYDTPNYRYY